MVVGVLGTVRAQKERGGMVVGTVEACWESCGLRWARSRVLGIVRAQKEAGDRGEERHGGGRAGDRAGSEGEGRHGGERHGVGSKREERHGGLPALCSRAR